MHIFSADATKKILPMKTEKLPSKVAHNWPNFFVSVLPTSPKPAQISISVP